MIDWVRVPRIECQGCKALVFDQPIGLDDADGFRGAASEHAPDCKVAAQLVELAERLAATRQAEAAEAAAARQAEEDAAALARDVENVRQRDLARQVEADLEILRPAGAGPGWRP